MPDARYRMDGYYPVPPSPVGRLSDGTATGENTGWVSVGNLPSLRLRGRQRISQRVDDIPLRQLLYHSRAVGRVDVSHILASAKRNNGMDGLTGILLFDGEAFLQVLEGPHDAVETAFERIRRDARHADVTIISDHALVEREFAYWSMELRDRNDPSDDAAWRLRRRLEQFDPTLHHHFFATTKTP